MTKIMATPFDDFNSFIEENHGYKLTQQNRQRRQPPPRHGGPSQDLMSYWGYKFETLSLLPDQWDATSREYIEGREDEIVNNYAQYCSVVKTGIGGAKMILGGEVDAGNSSLLLPFSGPNLESRNFSAHFRYPSMSLYSLLSSVWDAKPFPATDQPINWVELKTAAEIRSDKDMLKFERKLLKFWIQSFLLGVPKIVVGFRTPDGILTRLEELETKSLPGNVKRMGRGSWDGNLCINFAAAFLEFLKNTITTEGGVYRIRHRERNSVVEVFKVEETGHGNILTPEFVRWREELAGKHRAKTTTAAEST
ncbi:MAG: hypothetical protein M1819_007412 [Sarea resinae]|nr:MAG: hypothetical protein M1819_007412 [Sarea resinae]